MGFFQFFRNLFSKKQHDCEKIDFCIFGLGNPGSQYLDNRHNIGFKIIDSFSSFILNGTKGTCSDYEMLRGVLSNGIRVATVKPLTFMNNSGIAVKSVLDKYQSSKTRFIVVVDDFNLPLGTLRVRQNGSHGGHNGLKSIIAAIGPDFPRLRVGIGPLPEQIPVIDFVLGNFSDAEVKILDSVILNANEALKLFAVQNIDTATGKHKLNRTIN